MEITQKAVLRYFLGMLEKQMEVMKVSGISPFFKGYFTHEELKDIIKRMYNPDDLKQPKLDAMHTDELEEMVGNDANIPSYFIACWDMETACRESLDPKEVWKTLENIGMETHYLGSKPITDWDTYDHANYRSLRVRFGRIQKVYGIYDRMVSQDGVDRVGSQHLNGSMEHGRWPNLPCGT